MKHTKNTSGKTNSFQGVQSVSGYLPEGRMKFGVPAGNIFASQSRYELPAKGLKIYINGISSLSACQIAEQAVKGGADIFLSDENDESLQVALRQLNELRHTGGMKVNTKDFYQIENAVNKAFSFLGPIDIAINNYCLPDISTNIIDCSPDFYLSEFRSSFANVFLFIKYELSLMLGRQTGGRIINLFHMSGNELMENAHMTYAFMYAMKGTSLAIGKTYKKQNITIESYLLPNSILARGYRGPWARLSAFDLVNGEELLPIRDICDTLIDEIYSFKVKR